MANPIDIIDIIQTPILIKDDFIKMGEVLLDDYQSPIHYTGGFAVVFPFRVNGEKWAFRCWYNNIGYIGDRLNILSKELRKVALPYFCDFQYEEKGIVLDGSVMPTTRMLWIDGLNIKDYICQHYGNSQKLLELALNFKTMCQNLHRLHIAHGDLQHGNILVDSKDLIYLIDYDSIYLPALKGAKDIIIGLSSYQHPSRSRKENVFAHEKLDYFSELIIYLSILAIAKLPSLVDDYNIEKSENLLFTKEDFANLKLSSIYNTLIKLDDEINILLKILVEYLSKDSITDLKPFEDFLVKKNESLYCIICGYKFESKEDEYCIICGVKRI